VIGGEEKWRGGVWKVKLQAKLLTTSLGAGVQVTATWCHFLKLLITKLRIQYSRIDQPILHLHDIGFSQVLNRLNDLQGHSRLLETTRFNKEVISYYESSTTMTLCCTIFNYRYYHLFVKQELSEPYELNNVF